METGKISEAFRFILQLARGAAIVPITYNTTLSRFELMHSRTYIAYYYSRLGFEVLRIIGITIFLYREIFVLKGFDFGDGTSIVRLFFFFPISVTALANILIITIRKAEITSTLNTFLRYYSRFQSKSFHFNFLYNEY